MRVQIKIITDRETHLLAMLCVVFFGIIYGLTGADSISLACAIFALVCFMLMHINKREYYWGFSPALRNYLCVGVFVSGMLFLTGLLG